MTMPYWLADLLDDGPDSTMAIVLLVVLVALLVVLFWPVKRCALCRVPHEQLEHSRFGKVCAKCKDAVFRMYHYRTPRLSEDQARRILKNLWRDVEGYEFGGDGWKNG